MLEFGNVLNVSYGAWVVSGVYKGTGDSAEIPDNDKAVAVIKNLLRGRVGDYWENVHYANEVISALQTLAEGASDINEKLGSMEELAKQATSGTYSDEQIAVMQTELEQLAEEINEITNSAVYDENKFFSAEGQTISISIGNGSNIVIAAKDLSIDTEGLDLTTNAVGTLATIESIIGQNGYYSGYLNKQVERLESVMTLIEDDAKNAMGIGPGDFDTGFVDIVREVAGYAADRTLEEMSALFDALFDVQANLTPSKVLQLLRGRIEELAE